MSEKRCAELEREIRYYEIAQQYLKGVYLESLEMDHPEPSLEQVVDTGVYIQGRITEMECTLQMLKNVESVTE